MNRIFLIVATLLAVGVVWAAEPKDPAGKQKKPPAVEPRWIPPKRNPVGRTFEELRMDVMHLQSEVDVLRMETKIGWQVTTTAFISADGKLHQEIRDLRSQVRKLQMRAKIQDQVSRERAENRRPGEIGLRRPKKKPSSQSGGTTPKPQKAKVPDPNAPQ
jgi:hypothetical protein